MAARSNFRDQRKRFCKGRKTGAHSAARGRRIGTMPLRLSTTWIQQRKSVLRRLWKNSAGEFVTRLTFDERNALHRKQSVK